MTVNTGAVYLNISPRESFSQPFIIQASLQEEPRLELGIKRTAPDL